MGKFPVVLVIAVAAVGFTATLAAQTAPAAGGARAGRGAGGAGGGGRGPATPHAAVADQDARFGAQYGSPTPYLFTADYVDKAVWEKRADFVRHQALVAEGMWPMPAKTALNAVVYGKIDKPEYTVEKVFFTSLPGHYVTGSLYRPKNVTGKVPVILAPYGHWGTAPANGRFWIKTDQVAQQDVTSGAEKELSNSKAPLQASCTELARMGCVVFQWDLVGFCDSTAIAHQEGFVDADAVMRLQSFMGLQAWNTERSIDFVAALPDVDTTRIGISGSSGGGTQSFVAGVLDQRLAGLFPICMVGPDSQGGCICENTSLLRVGTNNIEFAATFAPRPQFDVSAQDFTKNFPNVGLPEMKRIYALEGGTENYGSENVPYPHNHNVHSREDEYGAINTAFKLGLPAPVVEKPFEVLSREQLTVWTAEHPFPADFGKAPAVRQYMTKANDDQLTELAKNVAEYRATIRVALQGMVADQLPGAKDVECSVDLTKTGEVQKGFIGCKGEHERIPFAYVKPANWNGTIVILADGKAASVGGSEASGALVKSGAMVVGIDAFMSGDFKRTTPMPPAAGIRNGYSGFANGYERTILANRVHDMLSLMGLSRGIEGVKSVRVVGSGEAVVGALYAAAIAGPAVSSTAVDLNGFDFDRVKDENDVAFIPGGLKYGGVYGVVPLCAGAGGGDSKIFVTGTRETGKYGLAAGTAGVTMQKESVGVPGLAEWVVK